MMTRNTSTNEITPLIDDTIRIATVEPFSNADFCHYALVYVVLYMMPSITKPSLTEVS